MSKRSVKKMSRNPDNLKITFKGLVAAGQEKARLAKLAKTTPQLAAEPAIEVAEIEVAEDDTDHGEAFHVHGDSCSHSE